MDKVAAVRVVKDYRHREPGMQGNQGDELKAKDGYLILDFTFFRDDFCHTFLVLSSLPWSLGSYRQVSNID